MTMRSPSTSSGVTKKWWTATLFAAEHPAQDALGFALRMLVAKVGELAQELLLLLAELGRRRDVGPDDEVAASASLAPRDAFAAQTEDRVRLRPRLDIDPVVAVERF